jgi:hypothetical protein
MVGLYVQYDVGTVYSEENQSMCQFKVCEVILNKMYVCCTTQPTHSKHRDTIFLNGYFEHVEPDFFFFYYYYWDLILEIQYVHWIIPSMIGKKLNIQCIQNFFVIYKRYCKILQNFK